MGNLNLHNWYDRTGLGLPGYPTALHCTAHQIPTVNRVKSWDGNFLGGILKVMKNLIIEPLRSRVGKIFIKKSSPKFVLKIELNGFQRVSSFKSPSIIMKVWIRCSLFDEKWIKRRKYSSCYNLFVSFSLIKSLKRNGVTFKKFIRYSFTNLKFLIYKFC